MELKYIVFFIVILIVAVVIILFMIMFLGPEESPIIASIRNIVQQALGWKPEM